MLLYQHLVNHARLTKDAILGNILKGRPIYEITNVVSLFDDWKGDPNLGRVDKHYELSGANS